MFLFPFLNCIENCNQKDLLGILPTLHHELYSLLIKILIDYAAYKLSSKLSQKILKDFCLAAVEALKIQYGREYGFANEK